MFWLVAAIAAYIAVLIDAGLPKPGTVFSHNVRISFWAITDIGKSAWIIILTGVLLLLMVATDWEKQSYAVRIKITRLQIAIGFVFLSVAGSGLVVTIVKRLIGRARPVMYETHGPIAFEPFEFSSNFASFPSGHATTIAAVCMAVAMLRPITVLPGLALALAVAASRYIGGVHYVGDTVAGLLFGAGYTYFVARWMVVNNLAVFAGRWQFRLLPRPARVSSR